MDVMKVPYGSKCGQRDEVSNLCFRSRMFCVAEQNNLNQIVCRRTATADAADPHSRVRES